MSNVSIQQMPAFKRVYKKLHKSQKKFVDNALRDIIKDPLLGTEQKGYLSGVFVYKFKIHTQDLLLSYIWVPSERMLLALGVHDNFYRDLKATSNQIVL